MLSIAARLGDKRFAPPIIYYMCPLTELKHKQLPSTPKVDDTRGNDNQPMCDLRVQPWVKPRTALQC